jgi:N-acetylglucosamine kinase-like BadF-type ATPase
MVPTAVIGVDIGGSKTHGVRVAADGTVVADATVGSANIESVTAEAAASALDQLVAQLGADGVGRVCVGSAGVNTPAQESWLRGLLADRVPGADVMVVHDTRLILAAAGLDVGIAVICGTGSVVWGRDQQGRTARSGGWGYLLGDEGSGYWVTREAVRHALRRQDSGLAEDDLTRDVLAASGVSSAYDLLGAFYAQPDRRAWARRSQLVFGRAATGDPAALAIVDGAADALLTGINDVADHLDLRGPVALGGGLAVNQALLQNRVVERLHRIGISDVRILDRDPVFGAVRLARLWSDGN